MAHVHFGIQTPQEGATFDALATHWRTADELGFDSVWLDDHFYSVLRPRSEPQMEAWTLLTALARETRRVRVGILVTCNGYRNPALLAKIVTTPVDGQASFAGRIAGVDDGHVLLQEGKRTHRVPMSAIRRAKLDIEF